MVFLTQALLALSLAQPSAPPGAPEGPEGSRPRLLVLDLEALSGVEPGQAKALTNLVTGSLQNHSTIDVVSSEDVRRMAELDASRQAIGCDAVSCLAEIAGALGASHVVYGSIAKLGGSLVVTLNLFDAHRGASVARESLRAGSFDALLDNVDPALGRLAASILGAPAAAPAPAAEEPASSTLSPFVIVGGAVGGAGLVAGAVLLGITGVLDGELGDPAVDGKQKAETRTTVIALGAAGVGALVLGAAGAGLLAYGLME
jgi:TolB-like protein